jgi:hypothetical protein
MSALDAGLNLLVGSPYSPAIAIAIFTILILVVIWVFGSVDSTFVKWVGLAGVVVYAGLGMVQNKKQSLVESAEASIVAQMAPLAQV